MAGPYILSYSLQDFDGDKNSVPIYIPNTTLIANALDFGTAMSNLIDLTSGCRVVEGSLILPLTMHGANKASAVANYEVERGALLAAAAANTNYRHTTRIPGWLNALFAGDAVVDHTVAGPTKDLVDALILGLTINGANVSPSDRYQNSLTAFLSGKKSHRTK